MSKIDPKFNDLQKAQAFIEEVQTLRQKLKGEEIQVSPFPLEIFPKLIQDIILATHRALKYPLDFTAAAILNVSSVCIGNTYQIEVKKGWRESAVLYMALVGKPGTNKSHPLSLIFRPLMDKDRQSYEGYQRDKERYELEMTFTAADRKDMKISPPVLPILKKYIVSDATPEALVKVHQNNPRGIILYIDELAAWFKNFNRYHKGADQEFWLSNWNSKSINIDRKNSESIHIARPFISVCGTIQTGILHDMGKNNRNKNGFIDRILMVMPEGLQVQKWDDQELDPQHLDNWRTIVEHLFDLTNEAPQIEPKVLKFDIAAKKTLLEWQATNADLCNSLDDDGLKGIFTKLQVYCVRFTLILALLEAACEQKEVKEINKATVQNAIALTEYFRLMATKTYMLTTQPNPLDRLPEKKKKFYVTLPETFKTSEAIAKAALFNISERNAKLLLSDKKLFLRLAHGQYEKLL